MNTSWEDTFSMCGKDLRRHIRNVPDFPSKGIVFRDITTLLNNPSAFDCSIGMLLKSVEGLEIDYVVGIEARGFIFGGILASRLNAGFVPIRKRGKLPSATIEKTYELEYGADTLAMHLDAFKPGSRILMFDDLLATGGTMAASCQMVRELGGDIVSCLFLIELAFLGGSKKLAPYPIRSILVYEEE